MSCVGQARRPLQRDGGVRASQGVRNALLCAMLSLACSCARGRPAIASRDAPAPVRKAAAPHAPATSPSPASGVSPARVDAVQRLTPRVGFVSVRTAAGPLLAKTTDAGATWLRLAAPAR